MTKKDGSQYSLDEMICILLSVALVAFLVKGLADVGMMNWWWGFFIVCNAAYIFHGMKEGWAKGDPVNGLVIVAGPIPFYFWTILGAWRKYALNWKVKKGSSDAQETKT